MFRLTELFVSIAADQSPVDKAIAGLKGSLPVAAGAIGGAFSSAFTVALGPIGLVVKGVQGLLSLLDEGNEDVAQLGEYWSEAMGPVKEAVEGVVHVVTDWIKGLVETVKASDYVQAAFAKFKEAAVDLFDSVKTGIDRGVEVFHQFKAAAEETFRGAVIILGDVYDSIVKTFGGNGLATVQSWGDFIQSTILTAIDDVGFAIRNWPEIFEIVKIQVGTKLLNIVEYMQTIPANAAIIGNYLANNWVKLIADAVSAVSNIFQNLVQNIGAVAKAIFDFLKDPSKGFKTPEFVGILDGFKATADEFPEMIKASLTEADISGPLAKIAENEAKRARHPAKEKTPEEAAAAEAAKGGGSFKSELLGIADLRSKIIGGIFSEKDDTAKRTLAAAERTAKATEKIADKDDDTAEYAP